MSCCRVTPSGSWCCFGWVVSAVKSRAVCSQGSATFSASPISAAQFPNLTGLAKRTSLMRAAGSRPIRFISGPSRRWGGMIMASAPSEPRPVLGRIDTAGRLIAADPELEALQRQAGARIGQKLALPQVAAIAQLARTLRIPIARAAVAASVDHDIELWVRAIPEGDEVALTLEGWTERSPAAARLASLPGAPAEAASPASNTEWVADEEMRIISLSPELADYLGVELAEAAGQPITRVVRLEENEAGE